MGLKGDLKSFGIAELLQSFSINQHTGLLVIEGEGKKIGIFFEFGEIVGAILENSHALRLGEVLLREGKISKSQLQEALEEQKKANFQKKLGEILLEKGWLSEKDLKECLRKKLEEEIYDLFFWEEASFEFHKGVRLEEFNSEGFGRAQPLAVRLDASSIVIEGMHRLDQWEKWRSQIPSFSEYFLLTDPSSEEVHRIRNTFYFDPLYLDGKHTLYQIAQEGMATLYEVLRGTHELLEKGLLRPANFEELWGSARELAASGQYHKIIPIYEKLLAESPRPELHLELAKGLLQTGQKDRALEHCYQGIQHYLENSEVELAAQHLREFQQHFPQALELKELEWKILHRQQKNKEALEVAEELLAKYSQNGELAKKIQILEELITLDGNPKWKKELAQLYLSQGMTTKGLSLLEEMAQEREKKGELKEALELYKHILELEPERMGIEPKMEQLRRQLVRRQKQRQRLKYMLLGGSLGFLLLLAIGYWFYRQHREEQAKLLWLKGKGLLSKIEKEIKEETFSHPLKLIQQVREIQGKLEKEYLSTDFGQKAQKERPQWEALLVKYKKLYEKKQREEERKRQAQKEFEELEKEIPKLLAQKQYQKLFQRVLQFRNTYPKSHLLLKLSLPIYVETQPPGALIRLDNKEYHTPTVAFYSIPSEHVKEKFFEVELQGYQSQKIRFSPWKFHRFSLKLKKAPWAVYPADPKSQSFLGRVEVPPFRLGKYLFLLSRKGKAYRLSLERTFSGRNYWEMHKSLPLTSPGETFRKPYLWQGSFWVVGTANSVLLCDLSRWRLSHKFPQKNIPFEDPLFPFDFTGAPVFVSNFQFAIANRNSQIYLFSISERTLVLNHTFFTIEPVLAEMVGKKRSKHFYAVTQTGRLLALLAQDNKLKRQWYRFLPDSVTTELALHKNQLLIPTDRGVLYFFDASTGQRLYRKQLKQTVQKGLVQRGEFLFLPTKEGQILKLRFSSPPQYRLLKGNFGRITSPLHLYSGDLFFGTEEKGQAFFVQYRLSEERVVWKYPLATPMVAPPLVTPNWLYLVTSEGKLLLFSRN